MDLSHLMFPRLLVEFVIALSLWGALAASLIALVWRTHARNAQQRRVGALTAIGIDPALLRSLMALDALVHRAQTSRAKQHAQAALPVTLQHDFHDELARAQARLASLQPQARVRHEPFLDALLHDAAACGFEVSAASSARG